MWIFYMKGWRGGWVGYELCLGGVGGWVSVVGVFDWFVFVYLWCWLCLQILIVNVWLLSIL